MSQMPQAPISDSGDTFASPATVPPPPQGTSGLAIGGLILAFLIAPIGFILSLIALFQTRKRRQKGKGLAIAGIIVSVLLMVGTTAIVVVVLNTVGKNITTVADPGCTAGKDAILGMSSDALNSSDPTTIEAELQKTVDGLNAAAAKAQHDNVRNAMAAVADDYTKLLRAVQTGTAPPANLESKITDDANQVDALCTIGGAGN